MSGAAASSLRPFALVALAAVLTVAAFPPLGAWPLALVMLAPLVVAMHGVRPLSAFTLTYAYLLAMALGIVRWLVYPLSVEYGVAAGDAWGTTVGLVAIYALPTASAVAAFAWLRPRAHPSLAPLLFAALYAFSEWLRASPLALPWLLVGHALAPAPSFLQIADLLGATGVSFVALAVSAGVGLAVATRSALPLAWPAALLALALAYGPLRAATLDERGATLRVGVVQAAVPQRDRWHEESAVAHTEQHAELTRTLLGESGALDLVVWPETAVDAVLEHDPRLLAVLRRQVEASGVAIVTGAQREIAGGITNSAFLVVPGDGLVESYEKQWLVPFAESRPAWGEALQPLLGQLAGAPAYQAGAGPRTFVRLGVPFATPICFEVTYPGLLRGMHADGARLLLNLSNDAWFGRTGYAEMHLAHAVLRAIELRTPVVRASASGISALIDARGRVAQRLAVGVRGALHGEVRANVAPTLYARFGDAPFLALLAAALATPLGCARVRIAVRPRSALAVRDTVAASNHPTEEKR